MMSRVAVVLAVLMVVGFGGRVGAGEACGEWDNRFGVPLDMDFEVECLTFWDSDGDGPLPEQLIAGGSFNNAGGVRVNNIARWDGSAWQPLGSGMNGRVLSLTTWDPDADGPQSAQLVAVGSFTKAGDVTVNRVAHWDGSVWQPFSTGMSGTVRAVTSWDPDGDGPEPAQLVAGGDFSIAGGVMTSRIARWDGTAWQRLASSGMSGTVWTLATWDPDGPGPLGAQLVAGGDFGIAGGVTVSGLARWDGVMWEPLGSGINGDVRSLTTWDPDGAGPLESQLVAGGAYINIGGGVTVSEIAQWDGSAWQPLGSGMNSTVKSLTAWDPDGDGPLPAALVAGGSFTTAGDLTVNHIARWDGASWQSLGSGMSNTVNALAAWDPDGAGPLPAQLVAGGFFITAGDESVSYIARWDPGAPGWQPFGRGMNNTVDALAAWDPDGAGPLPTQLVTGGSFNSAGGVTVNRIARWDGWAWQPLGSGMNNTVRCLISWDPDGDGPLAAQLVAGGLFTTAGGVSANRIARWDGAAWQPFGSGMSSAVYCLATWDPDGAGPQAAQLVAGGLFTTAGGVTVNRIARWDPDVPGWQPLGGGMNNTVASLTTWDPDGPGPLGTQLVAGGIFTTADGMTVNRIARWDGTAWQSLGSGTSSGVQSLAIWDPDGVGPLPAQLVAGGDFFGAGGVTVNRIARWDPDAPGWQPFGSGISGGSAPFVNSITTWDPDGAGLLAVQLIASGLFTSAGGVAVNNIARWDPGAPGWQPLGSGLGNSMRSLTTWDPDGAGPLSAQLVAGGSFTQAGGFPAGYMALWSTFAPDITTQPLGDSVSAGQAITLTVTARNGQPTYQWRRDAEPLGNGPTGSGSIISGTSTATLTITNAQPGDSGDYDCIVTNSCGSVISDVASLTVAPPPSCGGDANGDDVVNGADLSVLLFLFGQSVTPGTAADFNGDGVVDGADLSVLLFRFGTAC